jgi:ABC-type Fe3+-hydroxamate transport system substrate-binding protein
VSLVLAALSVSAGLRIVSLAPALTEDLFAIGAGPQVVGVDLSSNRPARANALPRVGGMSDVNTEAVLALHPDLVVGVPLEAAPLADLGRAGVRTASIPLDGLQDDLRAIERLGVLTRRQAAAHRVTTALRSRLDRLAAGARRTRRLSAFVWLGGMGAAGGGSFVDELLRLANLRNVAGDVRSPWITFSAEQLLRAQPDVVVVPDPSAPLRGEPWDRLAAVNGGRIVRVPEDDLFRPGPRVAEVLADLIAGVRPWR